MKSQTTASHHNKNLTWGSFLWARISVLILGIWSLSIAFRFTPESPPPNMVCVIKKYIGCECPACGITRGLTSLAHGRFKDAYHYYPFVFPVFIGVWFGIIGSLLPDQLWKAMIEWSWFLPSLAITSIATGIGIILHWVICLVI